MNMGLYQSFTAFEQAVRSIKVHYIFAESVSISGVRRLYLRLNSPSPFRIRKVFWTNIPSDDPCGRRIALSILCSRSVNYLSYYDRS